MKTKIIKGSQSNYCATIEENQSNVGTTIKGSQSNYCATIEEYQSNTSATIKGSQSNWDATIKGDIILKDCVIGNKKTKTSKLIAEFSKDRYWEDCTLTEFIKWLGERKE